MLASGFAPSPDTQMPTASSYPSQPTAAPTSVPSAMRKAARPLHSGGWYLKAAIGRAKPVLVMSGATPLVGNPGVKRCPSTARADTPSTIMIKMRQPCLSMAGV